MSELLNFPFVNQRTDGDINHDYDCVPASLQAGANYLLGGNVVNGRAMKDEVYGAGFVGGTAAIKFVGYLQARGVHIYAIDGSYSALLASAHRHLAAGHPVVFTRDDPYSSNPADSHVSVWYKDAGYTLTAMDPFGAQSIMMSDAVWTTHLRGNELWIMEKTTDMLTISDPWVQVYFKQVASGPDRWHCATTGYDLFAGILGGWCKMNGAPRLPTGPETSCGQQAVYQRCESGIMVYDPAHELDGPRGPWEPCYLLKFDSALAQKLLNIGQPTPPQPPPLDWKAQATAAVATLNAALPHLN